MSTIIGVGCAWFVTAYNFTGRKYIELILILPLTIPTYIERGSTFTQHTLQRGETDRHRRRRRRRYGSGSLLSVMRLR